jgi:hypothetical protein
MGNSSNTKTLDLPSLTPVTNGHGPIIAIEIEGKARKMEWSPEIF